MSDLSLAEFPEVSAKQWKQFLQFSLNGQAYESLLTPTREHINIKPFYHADDNPAYFLSDIPEQCTSFERLIVKSAQETIAQIKAAQKNGIHGFWLKIISETIDLQAIFQAIDLADTPLYIECNFLSLHYLKRQAHFLKTHNHRVQFGIDPIGHLSKSGNWYIDMTEDLETFKAIIASEIPVAIALDAAIFQEAGATCTQQLAYTLSICNTYLNRIEDKKSSLCQIVVKSTVGLQLNFETAKLKAMRLLLSQLADFHGISPHIKLITYPSSRYKTAFSPALNLPRITTAYQAAYWGGADSICAQPAEFISVDSTRAQHNLSQFLNAAKTDGDLAKGSYYLNDLVKQFSENAVIIFKSIDRENGYLQQLKAGKIQQKIKASAQNELKALQQHDLEMIGLNSYQDKTEQLSETAKQQLSKPLKPRKTLIEPIITGRIATVTEHQRLHKA